MLKEILSEAEARMKKTCELFRKELAALRAGRASAALLDRVLVDYYGVPTPVNQMATVNVPEPRLLIIQPWDRTTVSSIEKAILKSDLGITPQSDGHVIRLVVPQLTEERRQELVKTVRKKAEEERVAIRNVRRDTNDMIRELEKEGEISEDQSKRALEDVQKLTDKYIAQIDQIMKAKEEEITEV